MDTKQLSKIFKALSNPNRLKLFIEILKNHEACFQTGGECFITDIIDCLSIGAPTISHHLKELANADLISTERKGKFLVAMLNEDTLKEIKNVVSLESYLNIG